MEKVERRQEREQAGESGKADRDAEADAPECERAGRASPQVREDDPAAGAGAPRPDTESAEQRAQARAASAGQAAADNAVPIAVGAALLLLLVIWIRRR